MQRVGPSDEDVVDEMIKLGKKDTMAKLFKGFQNYIVTLSRGEDVFKVAKEYFDSH
tara:strand:- start:877 stop:1044 length:168 start_codon:yes stop_codon:yes gene_type:complete